MTRPIHLETEIEIAAPRDAVWQALVDVAHYGMWNGYLRQVDGVLRAGESLRVHADMGGEEPLVSAVSVVSVDPPRSMRWEGGTPDRSLFTGDHWWELDALDSDRTQLLHHEFFTGTLAVQIVGDGGAIRANFERMNQDLKHHVEGRRDAR